MNKLEDREGRSCCCFAQCTVCTDPALATRNKQTKNLKPQHLSKFSETLLIAKMVLTRGFKVLWSPGKHPWQNSASSTLSFCSMDHETKRKLYLLTLLSTDKTKEKKFVFLCAWVSCEADGLEPAVAYMATAQLLMGATS